MPINTRADLLISVWLSLQNLCPAAPGPAQHRLGRNLPNALKQLLQQLIGRRCRQPQLSRHGVKGRGVVAQFPA
jgi:hypothetical protein